MKINNKWIRARFWDRRWVTGFFCFGALLSFFLVFPPVSSAEWTIEAIDAPRNFTNFYSRAIAIDKVTNQPHIVYGQDHLYHSYFDGTQWQYETVDNSPGVGEYASMAIDSNSKIHISYYDSTNRDLKYASNASGSWVTSVIDSTGSLGKYTSIALDSNNKIHIAYYDEYNYDLKYATNASGSWVTSIIDSTATAGHMSIAIDSNNKVHISYYDITNYDLKYASNASGSWVTSIIDSTGAVGQYTSIAIDLNDKVHISYYDYTNQDLKYASNASGSWVTSIIDSTGTIGQYTSIAIDSNDKVHISYYAFTKGDLKYATNASGSWVTSIIDSTGTVGQYTSIAIDPNDKVHISYYASTNGDLKYATNASGPWVTSIIDSTDTVGQYASIAIDSNDKVHISYYASTNGDLKYATNVSGSWVTSIIDSTGNIGKYTSIAIDSNDKVHISYYDYTNGDLKYATNASGSWVTSIIDATGTVGQYASIAIDSNDKVHIGYYDYTNQDLKYATNVSGSWVTSIIDSTGNIGKYTSIAIDLNDEVHVSYSDSSNYDLKYATNVSGSWVTSIIDSTGYAGDTSIVVDSNNNAHVSYSYFDTVNTRLKYATNASGTWVIFTIDNSTPDVGNYTSIALDSAGKAHISYFDDDNKDLRYANNTLGAWAISTVDSTGTVGRFTSITLDSAGKAHISYHDDTNGDLKSAVYDISIVTDPDITVAPTSINFGGINVGTISEQILIIRNDGTADLILGNIAEADPIEVPYFSIATDNCSGQTLTAAASCTLTVRFAPLAQSSVADQFDIPSNDPDENPVTVNVSGLGGAADITVSPVSVNFGGINFGNMSDQTITVTNDGTVNLVAGNIAQADPVAAPFSIMTDTCSGQTLAPTASCTLIVRFAPASSGSFSDSFDMPSNDPDENPVTVSLTGTGGVRVSGQITNAGAGLGDVTVSLTDTNTATTTTDNSGSYSFNGLLDGSYTVTPDKAGYTFTPASWDITVNNADVTGVDFEVVPPDIVVSPAAFVFNLIEGGLESDTLTITNIGTGSLTYSITTEVTTGSSPQGSGINVNVAGYDKMLSVKGPGNRKYEIPEGAEYNNKHILVKFKEGVTDSEKKNIHKKTGGAVEKKYKKTQVEKVKISNKKIINAINEYLADERVEYAEPDYIIKASLLPNDAGFSQLWGLHNTGQAGGTVDADIDAPEAWDITTGGNVVVAVIDTGVNYNHEDLSANMWVNANETPGNGIDDDGNGYIDDYRGWNFINETNDPMDDNGHGTHCSGTIAGVGNNGVGVTGINWSAKIMPLKFLGEGGSGNTSDAVEAVLYATEMGVRVSSNSWGGGGYSQTLYDAIKSFGDAGGLFVASAGNDGGNTDSYPDYPSNYDLSNIISVAATDKNDTLASFSNYGASSVDLAAPGVSIYSTIISGYGTKSGTSMAAPHVSGVAALVLGKNQLISVADVKNIIMSNVDPIPSLSGKMVTGGRLNARKAVAAAGISWLSLSSTSEVLAPGANASITVTANTAALTNGAYNANIVISSNDPDENPVTVPVSLTVLADKDGDGYPSDIDCDDNNPLEHPGQTWFLDADNDGYSEGTANTSSCFRPAGYKAASELAEISGDCDDNNYEINPITLWYPDSDSDGHGNPAVSLQQCIQPAGYVLSNTDCNDYDANIYPGGPPVRIADATPVYFTAMQSAYDAALDGDTIEGQAITFSESLNFNLNKSVTLNGGYDCGYTAVSGQTIINGPMTISNGTVTAGSVELQ